MKAKKPKHSYVGARQVTATEAEINKNNRLATMMEIHAKRQQQWKEQMTDQKITKCEICGAEKKTGMNHGKMACPSCMVLQAKAKNSPEIVTEVMRSFHGDKYFQPAGENQISAGELEYLQECETILQTATGFAHPDADPTSEKYYKLLEGLPQYIEALNQAYDIEHEQVAMLFQALKKSNESNIELKDAKDVIQELADQKTKEIDRLATVSLRAMHSAIQVKEPYELHGDLQPATPITINTFDSLHDLLWLLKGMVITGNANGPGQQHIDALEEVVGKSPVCEEVV